MPNCFQLSRKTDPEHKPVKFVEIDDEMCAYFGVPSDPVKYHYGWYDFFGLCIAQGAGWPKIREILGNDKHGLEIADFLEARFDSDAWYAPKSITG